MNVNNRLKEYALYKGDEIIGIGTVKELAKITNVKEKTIRFYLNPSYKKRAMTNKGNHRVLIKIGEDEE